MRPSPGPIIGQQEETYLGDYNEGARRRDDERSNTVQEPSQFLKITYGESPTSSQTQEDYRTNISKHGHHWLECLFGSWPSPDEQPRTPLSAKVFPLSQSSISQQLQSCFVCSSSASTLLIVNKHSNMIHDDSKFFSLSGDIPVGGPSTWHVVDWDQRRVVSVTMDGEQDDESLAIEHFSRYSSQLCPDVYRIHVSDTGGIISTYTDPKNDQTCCVHYPSLHEALLPEGIQTVRRDELEELERLGPDTDLVAYPPSLGKSAKNLKPHCLVL